MIWDVDTAHPYQTVNGQKARDGALDCAGPAIAGGMLCVTYTASERASKPGGGPRSSVGLRDSEGRGR
jgi:hypothetical protein